MKMVGIDDHVRLPSIFMSVLPRGVASVFTVYVNSRGPFVFVFFTVFGNRIVCVFF